MASILLLNSDESILDISIKVGYPTLSSFNRQFNKLIHMSPREWRKKVDITKGISLLGFMSIWGMHSNTVEHTP